MPPFFACFVAGRFNIHLKFGLDESMKDAVQFKFMAAPLNENQLKELIQVPPNP